MNIDLSEVEAVVLSHLHPDHLGGYPAIMKNKIGLSSEMQNDLKERRCYVPETCDTGRLIKQVVSEPQALNAGIFSTGPLARSLYFGEWTEEQALVFNVKGKGLVVFTDCGHPIVEVLLRMVRSILDEKIYAFGGGLHFSITKGRRNYRGIETQMILGTGKKTWESISNEDLTKTIAIRMIMAWKRCTFLLMIRVITL